MGISIVCLNTWSGVKHRGLVFMRVRPQEWTQESLDKIAIHRPQYISWSIFNLKARLLDNCFLAVLITLIRSIYGFEASEWFLCYEKFRRSFSPISSASLFLVRRTILHSEFFLSISSYRYSDTHRPQTRGQERELDKFLLRTAPHRNVLS